MSFSPSFVTSFKAGTTGALLFILLASLSGKATFARSSAVEFQGRVLDPSGAVVVGATIELA